MLIDYKSYIYYLFKNVLSCLINVLSKIRQAKALFIVVLIGVSYCLSTFCTYCFIFCYLIFFYIFFLIYFNIFFLEQYRKKDKTIRQVSFNSIFRGFKCLIISKTLIRQLRHKKEKA